MLPTLKRQRASASTDSEPQSASPSEVPLDTEALPSQTAVDILYFAQKRTVQALLGMSVEAPSGAWKSLVNGIQPFPLRSEQLQNIVDTFRRGEGSLIEHVGRMGVWRPGGVDASDNVHRCARTGDLHLWLTTGPDNLWEVSATITENNEIASDLKSLRKIVKERFTYHLKPGDSTRLTLMSRGIGHWTYEAWADGTLAVKGGKIDEDILYRCDASLETSANIVFQPSRLDAFSQEPCLSWINFPNVAPGSQRS